MGAYAAEQSIHASVACPIKSKRSAPRATGNAATALLSASTTSRMTISAARKCRPKRSRGAPSSSLCFLPAQKQQRALLVLSSSTIFAPNKSRMLTTVLLLACHFHNPNNRMLLVNALDGFARPAWNLPPVTSQKAKIERRHPFLQQCESFAALMEHLRGGGGDGDDWRSYGAPPDEGEHDDYYGDDPYYGGSSSTTKARPPRGYDDYEDYSPSLPSSSTTFSNIPRVLKYGDRKIGLALLTAGLAVTALGFTLFFNRALLRLGNLLFMAGVPLTIGPARTLGYFAKPEKLRATACLALGIALVFVGHPILGIIAEVFGLLNIFGNMFPFLMVFLKQVPVLGPMLKQTGGNGGAKKKKKRQPEDDDYYNDYYNDDNGQYGGSARDGDEYYSGGQQQQPPAGQNYYSAEDDYRDPYGKDGRRGYY